MGIDGCRQGWVAFVLPEERVVEGFASFAALVAHLGAEVTVAGVDMPLSIPETGERQAELEVREALGPFRSSLFITPTREALAANTQAEASTINRRNGGLGVTAQAFALRHKIAEVGAARPGFPLIEVHPELTFATLGPVHHRKRTWAGVRERVSVLRGQGLHPWQWNCGDWAAADDTLDAAAAALSAQRYALGQALAFPAEGTVAEIFA